MVTKIPEGEFWTQRSPGRCRELLRAIRDLDSDDRTTRSVAMLELLDDVKGPRLVTDRLWAEVMRRERPDHEAQENSALAIARIFEVGAIRHSQLFGDTLGFSPVRSEYDDWRRYFMQQYGVLCEILVTDKTTMALRRAHCSNDPDSSRAIRGLSMLLQQNAKRRAIADLLFRQRGAERCRPGDGYLLPEHLADVYETTKGRVSTTHSQVRSKSERAEHNKRSQVIEPATSKLLIEDWRPPVLRRTA